MRFIKMNGLGNDYIFIDKRKNKKVPTLQTIPSLCDRNFGIGADGVVFIDKSSECTLKMIIFNADGSRAELCGNALRCVAKYEYDRKKTKGKKTIGIETDVGIKFLEVNGNHIVANMGKPRIEKEILYPGTDILGTVVYIGNPHFVAFCPDKEMMDTLFDRYAGSISEDTDHFPKRTNVEFVVIDSEKNESSMRVYERGSRETLACGTGATAVFETSFQKGYLTDGAKFFLRGGEITFTHDPSGNVLLCGAAQYNFKGKI